LAEELDMDNVSRTLSFGPVIEIENGTFTWDKEDEPVLKE